MNEEINLCTYISIYNEFDSLIKNYFTRKINAKENLDDVMIKIYPKFKIINIKEIYIVKVILMIEIDILKKER